MKHRWILDEDGNPDEFAFESGFHNGVICEDCGKSVCVCCHPDYMEMDDCPGVPAPKHMSNADRIRAMSDEDMAIMFAMLRADLTELDMQVRAYRGQDVNDNYDWLRRPCIEG